MSKRSVPIFWYLILVKILQSTFKTHLKQQLKQFAKNHKKLNHWHRTDLYYRKKCNPENYAEFLRDGKIFSEVLAASCPTPLGQAKELPETPTDRQRIEKLIYDLFDFGVQPSNLFEPDDLLKGRNVPRVRIIENYRSIYLIKISIYRY